MIPSNPFDIVLTPEEQEIERDIANGLYVPLSPSKKKAMMKKLQQASKSRQAKKTISIRLDPQVIHTFKMIGLKTGIPYQTLMASRLAAEAQAMRAG